MSALLQDVGFWAVGSLPPDLVSTKDYPNPDEVQEFWAKHLKPGRHDGIGGGEVRPEQQVWIVGYSNRLARAAGIPDKIEKYSSEVWHYPQRIRLGLRHANRHMMAHEVPRLGFAQWAIEDRKAFDAQNYDGAEFTFGLASPIAYRMFSGAMFTRTEHIAARILEELWELHDSPEFGPEKFVSTIWQWEVPFEMFVDAYLPEPMEARERRYRKRLSAIKWIMSRAPKGMRISLHPCWGDLGGRPAVIPALQKTSTKIAMMNAFGDLEIWGDHTLVNTHDPFGDGVHAPGRLTVDDFRLYERDLRLREGAYYSMGLLSNRFTDAQLPGMVDDARRLIEITGGNGTNLFRFSTHCGLGRKTVRDTVKILQQYHAVKQELTAA